MKSISLKLQLLILGLIMHSTSYAYDVEVNGIYYNIIEKAKVAEVTYKGSSFNEFKSYSGEVQIPSQIMYMENVYRVVCISKDAFRNCTDLTSISFTESIEKIENDAFSGCIALTTVNVTSLESWLKIDFSSRYSNPIVYTHRLFVDGVEVVDLVIPQNITEIKNIAFCGGSSINSVIFHNSLSSIGYLAFEGCTSLTSIQLPESITAIHGGAFSKCTNLVSVNIPTCINKIESTTFYGCSKLSDITIPESVESIGMEAFYGCSSLTSINIPSSIKEIEAFAFDGCNEIKYVDIGSLESWCTIEFKDGSNPLTYAHKLLIRGLEETDIVIPNEITKINQKVFCGCKNIKSITIPNSVTSIGRAAFSGCSSLTSIIIPNSVKTIEPYAFSGCIGLSSITLSNSLNAITEAMFYNCTNLKVITIPNSVETIGEKAFSNCSNLTTIIIGNGLNYIFSEAFSNCSNMESFTCLASIVPYQRPNVFLNSYVNYATLYVPQELLQKYESNYNWNIFGTIKTLSDSEPYKIWEANIAASDAVIAMINAIGKVKYTDACKNKINDANSAYDALTDEQKTLVVNYDVLTTAKQTYATLKVAADKVASDAVIAQIDAIGEVEYTDVCKNKIDEANKAYDILTDEQKALVTNLDVLNTAKQTYETLKAAVEKLAADKVKANAVIAKINAIGNVEYTDACKGKIDEASTAYNALTADQKVFVTNLDVLTTAKQTYETLKAAAEKLAADKAMADPVIAKINAIGTVEYTYACKDKIDEANNAYNALTADQKNLVTNLDVLTTAKQTYDALKAIADKLAADKARADAVIAKINAIGMVEYTDACKGKINDVSTAYEALTEDQKALVTNLDVLTTAKQNYENLKTAAEKLAADKALFDKYKSEVKAIIEALAKVDDSDAVKAIINKAISDINAMEYDVKISLDENKAKILSFINLIDDAVEKQRAEDQKTNGINELQITNDELPVYDLNGRKITNSMLKSGLYIRNGKKYAK